MVNHSHFEDLRRFRDCYECVNKAKKPSYTAADPLMRERGWQGGDSVSSRCIARLEKVTGRTLKERTYDGIRWTEDAKELYAQAKKVLADIDLILSPQHARRLRVASTNTLIHWLLIPFFNRTCFGEALDGYDDVIRGKTSIAATRRRKTIKSGHRTDVQFLEAEYGDVLNYLRAGDADAALGPLVPNPDFHVIPLVVRPWSLVFHETKYKDAAPHGSKTTIKAVAAFLKKQTVAVLPNFRQPGYLAEQLHEVLEKSKRLIFAPNYAQILQLVSGGTAVSLVPDLRPFDVFGTNVKYVEVEGATPAGAAVYLWRNATSMSRLFARELLQFCCDMKFIKPDPEAFELLKDEGKL